ncbi:hypothetical protein Tco_0363797 [Tanacetum coccineum]
MIAPQDNNSISELWTPLNVLEFREAYSTDSLMRMKDFSGVLPAGIMFSIDSQMDQVDQNVAECVDERAALANLIENLTLETEENKTILKQLKKANASLTQELEECKTNLDETSRALGRLLAVYWASVRL